MGDWGIEGLGEGKLGNWGIGELKALEIEGLAD